MKFRFILFTALAACTLLMSACSTNTNDKQTGTTTSTAATTMNGEYNADSDGDVNDDNVMSTTPATDPRPDNGSAGGEATDETSPVPGGTTGGLQSPDGSSVIADEAAFAPSYIDIIPVIGWGLGKDTDRDNRPIDAVNAEEKYSTVGGRFLAPDGKICLTFDEGYENGYTAQILDTLKEKSVKAVFFVTYDYCLRSPELVKRMIDEGHIVGNHTKTHPSMPELSAEQMKDEVQFLHEYVSENFGYEMKLFRFPKGEFSEQALEVLKNLGYTSLFWSFAYSDWDTENQPDPTAALEKIEKSTHSGIYLLHAVSRTNAEILPELLDYWQENGYNVGTEY